MMAINPQLAAEAAEKNARFLEWLDKETERLDKEETSHAWCRC